MSLTCLFLFCNNQVILIFIYTKGMDNQTIRRVVVYNVGKNPFDLWQKIGRACRDGKQGEAVLMVRGKSAGGLFVKGVCMRHCILSKLMGYTGMKSPSFCKCSKKNCQCTLCKCCEVCVLKCSCSQKSATRSQDWSSASESSESEIEDGVEDLLSSSDEEEKQE
jgi:hypothetical protein